MTPKTMPRIASTGKPLVGLDLVGRPDGGPPTVFVALANEEVEDAEVVGMLLDAVKDVEVPS